MAKLKRKNNIQQKMSKCYSNAEMAHRAVERVSISVMDDMRIILAYSAHNQLGYSRKRLERLEAQCNGYIDLWRKDSNAQTIDALRYYAKAMGYDYKALASKSPAAYCWAQFNSRMPKQYRNYYPMERRTQYITGYSKIIILIAIGALTDIRVNCHDITKAQIKECIEYFIKDLQCLADKKTGVSLDDIKAVLKEECNYEYGKLDGGWTKGIDY